MSSCFITKNSILKWDYGTCIVLEGITFVGYNQNNIYICLIFTETWS